MRDYLRLCISILVFGLSLISAGQDLSISGTVVDENNVPIELANTIVLDPDAQFVKGTSTGPEGRFKIEGLAATTYILKISFIGYDEFEQKIALNGQLDLKTIQLNAISENLNEVTVIAKKPTITRKPDRLIFNVENTALSEGTTLGVLQSTPGIIVSESGVNIKSSPATVFINERRVQLTSTELIQLLESAPANSIKSVEVITNPPASYDADSGSVINIIMDKNLVSGYRGSIQTNYTQGVFPRYNAATSHYFKTDKINLNLNYSYTNQKINRDQDDRVNYFDEANVIDEIWTSNVNRNTWSETHNLNLNFDYYLDDKNTLSLTSTGLYTPYFKYQIQNQTDIFSTDETLISSFTADNLSQDNKYNIGTDLIFSHDFDNNANLTFSGHFTIYDYNRDQNVVQDEPGLINDSEFNTIANQDTQIITGKLDYNLPLTETSTFEAGLKYSNVNTDSDITRLDLIDGSEVVNPDNTDAFIYDEQVVAAYANYSKSWEKWDLNVGLRAEQTNIEGESLTLNETNTQDYLNWFPNVSLAHQVLEELNVFTNYKRSITRPSYTDLNPFTFFINENTVVLGNPNLIPSYRDYFRVGANFLEHFTIAAYYSDFDGDIIELPRQNNETNIIAFTPTNLDKKVEYGFDFEFQYAPNNSWSLYAVTSVYHSIEEANFGEGFVELDQWSNYSVLQNALSLLEDRSLNINLTLTWVGKNLLQLQTVEDRLFSELSITKSILNKRGIISLSVDDIFNFQDEDRSLNYLNQSNSTFMDLDNRFVKIGFRYKFGNTKLTTNERATSAEERDRLKDLN